MGRLVLVAPAANVESLSAGDYLLAAPVVGWLASIGAMAGGGLVLGAGPVRRWVAEVTALDDRYLRGAGRTLLSPYTWRSFVREQRLLVRDLPALERRLGEISAPTTVVAGTADNVVPIAAARRLAGQIPGAELVEVEHAGHLLHQHHAGEVARVIAGGRAVSPARSPAHDRRRVGLSLSLGGLRLGGALGLRAGLRRPFGLRRLVGAGIRRDRRCRLVGPGHGRGLLGCGRGSGIGHQPA